MCRGSAFGKHGTEDQYFRFLAASDFFLRLTLGFS